MIDFNNPIADTSTLVLVDEYDEISAKITKLEEDWDWAHARGFDTDVIDEQISVLQNYMGGIITELGFRGDLDYLN